MQIPNCEYCRGHTHGDSSSLQDRTDLSLRPTIDDNFPRAQLSTFIVLRSSKSNSSQNHKRDRIFLSYAVVFGFLIPVLVNVVAANADGTNEPLLEKNGINMWFFLVGIGGYCAALNADIKSRIHQANWSVAAADTNFPTPQTNSSNICSLIAVVFGSLSTVSLVSILVPRVIGYVILGISWISAATLIAVYQHGRLVVDPGLCIHNKFMKPIPTKTTRNCFKVITTSFSTTFLFIKQPKAASNAST